MLQTKAVRAYLILTSLVICGLSASLITGTKLVHIGINFPFSNIVFSIFTYPIVDCICELWGQKAARQALWLGLASQLLLAFLLQLSIITPPAIFWPNQVAYQTALSVSGQVIIASLVAFSCSQILDIFIYQRIKDWTQGKWLWLRSNISTYLGQTLDSIIFVSIVFYQSPNPLKIILGSVMVKIILSFLMTPVVYFIVIIVNRYLESNTLAFKNEKAIVQVAS